MATCGATTSSSNETPTEPAATKLQRSWTGSVVIPVCLQQFMQHSTFNLGTGVEDVVRFICTSASLEVLTKHEHSLLQLYFERINQGLKNHGLPPRFTFDKVCCTSRVKIEYYTHLDDGDLQVPSTTRVHFLHFHPSAFNRTANTVRGDSVGQTASQL